MSLPLLIASHDEQFREMVRDNLLNQPNARIANEYPDVLGQSIRARSSGR